MPGWDLAQRYFTECLKLPASVLGGCGLVSNMLYPPKRKELDKYFDEVPTNNMYPGDVCIWEYGHIALFDHWDGKQCWYFSQNPNPCRVITINRGGLHAFRLKNNVNYTGIITYQVYTNRWLSEIKKCDNTYYGYAGIYKQPITAFRCKPQYGEIIYEAHELNGKWLGAVNSKNYSSGGYNSYAGILGRKIDGIRIKSTKGYVDYRVHTIEDGWLEWAKGFGDKGNEFAGIYGHTIDGIQMK